MCHSCLQLASLPDRIRPGIIGFGGLADGFMPFQVPHTGLSSRSSQQQHQGPPDSGEVGGGTKYQMSGSSSSSSRPVEIVLGECSLVMKAVQARLVSITGDDASVGNHAGGQGGCSSSSSSSTPAGQQQRAQHLQGQACAVKLGDDVSMSKAQVDPRLPLEVQEEVKQHVVEMARRTQKVTAADHGVALSRVLREAFVAVVEEGCLQGTVQVCGPLGS